MVDKQKEQEQIEQKLMDALYGEEKEADAVPEKEELTLPLLTEDIPEEEKQQDLESMKQQLMDVLFGEEKEPEEAPEKEDPVSVLTEDIPEEDAQQDLLDAPVQEEKEPEAENEEPVPAFEDPDRIMDPKEPLVYCNFSNDYGKELEEALKEEQPEPTPEPVSQQSSAVKAKKDEKLIISLMLAVSALCVGILGVFIYWLETFLKLL